jgi:threonine-phosphate decarboxylase
LPGNGANELIYLLARALLRPGDLALVVGPTYGSDFQLDLASLHTAIAQHQPRLTWLCAPNNPTGIDLAPSVLAALATTCAFHGGLLIVDRSYTELRRTDQPPAALIEHPNLLSLHSLTKSYALAGLRLGYLLATPAQVAQIAAYQPAWSVSSAAQAAALAALADQTFLARTVPQLWQASDALSVGLQALDLEVWRAALPFMLVRVGNAAQTQLALLQRGCMVRDCASFGLPAWVRVAPRQPTDNQRLLAAWKEIV